uniref:GP49 n=1 Tax=Caviid herpesvirus 2 str. CIDMTR TaxID=1415526 RepID=U6HC22_9BETA|nr:GP49 [Caviid herpesvirus 2 str. CIDMTR]
MAFRLRQIVCELLFPLCRHDGDHHFGLLLTGSTLVDRGVRCVNARHAQSSSASADREHSRDAFFCTLDLFVTDRRFLSKDLVDRFYSKFSKAWLELGSEKRECISVMFKRVLITKSFFMFINYMYLLHCICQITDIMSIPFVGTVRWSDVEKKLRSYPVDRLETLLECMSMQHFSDLHRHVFGVDFRIPFSNQMSTPCMSLLRLKDYECVPDIVLYNGVNWSGRGSCGDSFAASKSLVEGLRRAAVSAPCGNPLYVMAKALVENYCRNRSRYLIPLGKSTFPDILRVKHTVIHHSRHKHRGSVHGRGSVGVCRTGTGNAFSEPDKIIMFGLSVALRHGISHSLLNLPMSCFCKTKCERYRTPGSLYAVVCNNCGHCLNLGKERLYCGYTFPLNSMLYYRDKQEKSVIFSTHNDLAHCSLCGSQYLSKEPIYSVLRYDVCGFRIANVLWRAVTGSNSSCAVYNNNVGVDIIVPCSSRTCFSTVVLRKITTDRLLRLITHGSDFSCQLCQNNYRETCLDGEGRSDGICVGCEIVRDTYCRYAQGGERV